MRTNLRKVIFSDLHREIYPSNVDQDFREEMEESSKKQTGYFHRWFEEVDTSKEIPCIRPVALIEDEDGKLHQVDYLNVQFIKE